MRAPVPLGGNLVRWLWFWAHTTFAFARLGGLILYVYESFTNRALRQLPVLSQVMLHAFSIFFSCLSMQGWAVACFTTYIDLSMDETGVQVPTL